MSHPARRGPLTVVGVTGDAPVRFQRGQAARQGFRFRIEGFGFMARVPVPMLQRSWLSYEPISSKEEIT